MRRWRIHWLLPCAMWMLLGGVGGCRSTCPGRDVPVSLEGLYDFARFFGPCYYHYPYSCPPCPYACGTATYEYPVSIEDRPAASETPAPIPAPEPDPPQPLRDGEQP